jgi:uncharacterized RDD family membrane protein YckC
MQSGRRLTDLEPAGLARRTGAFAIDCAMAGVIVIVLYQLMLATAPGQLPTRGADKLVYAVLLFWLTFALYFALFESRGRHATPGKRLARIDVASISASPVSFTRALLRLVVKLLPILVTHVFMCASVYRFSDPATGALTIPSLEALGPSILAGLLLALVLLGALLFTMMLHPDGRGAHDMVAGTFVVRTLGDAIPGAPPRREAPVR